MHRFETVRTNRPIAGHMWKSGTVLDLTDAPAIWATRADNFNQLGKVDTVRMLSTNIIPVNAKTLIVECVGVSEYLTISGIYENVEIRNALYNLPCIVYTHYTPGLTTFVNCATAGLYKYRHRGVVVFEGCNMTGQLNLYTTNVVDFKGCNFSGSWILYCRDTSPEVRVGRSNTRSEALTRPRLPAGTLALCAADLINPPM